MTATLLAQTGADPDVVTLLAIVAAVLGGLGATLIVVRIALHRRQRALSSARVSTDEHPLP